MKKNTFLKKEVIFFVLTGLIIIFGVGLLLLNMSSLWGDTTQQSQNLGDESSYQRDLAKLQEVPQNFVDIRQFFVTLAQEKGGAYAFEVLKRASLPPNTDFHLLGHAVGDELYKQEGLPGMTYCTQDLRNACSHSIVIGALLANGQGVFDEVNEVCANAPGGVGAYTMCFHGFGHGVLAYTDYEIPDAVKLCERVGTEEYNNNEYHQCVGGIVMEMNQGVHDTAVWEQKKDKYLDPEDPLKLCKAEYMPDEAKGFCYTYITPYIFDSAGVNPVEPTDESFVKAFAYCDEVTEDDLRRICYAGFGKEFIVLAQGRDIRAMEDMTNEQLGRAINWCDLAADTEGRDACLLEIQNSLYWGGENEYGVSVRYCENMPSQKLEASCFAHMFENVSYYERNPETRVEICEAIPEEYKNSCNEVLLTN